MYISQKAKKDTPMAWLIVLSSAGFFFFDFVQICMMNTLGGDLQSALGITQAQVTDYIAVPFGWGNWLFLFPAALMIDRLSIRRIILSMLGLSIVGALGTAWSQQPWLTAFFRFSSGTAHAFCFLCCTTLANRWFSPKRRAVVMSLVVSIGVSGLLAAQSPLYYATKWLGWRGALSLNAGIGVLSWVVAFLAVKSAPKSAASQVEQAPVQGLQSYLQDVKAAFGNLQSWLYAIAAAALNAPIAVIVFIYLNIFLQQVQGVKDGPMASTLSTIFFFGHIIGIASAGGVSNRLKSRKKPLIAALLVALLLLSLLLFFQPIPFYGLVLLLFVLGAILGAQVISYPAISELNDPRIAAQSMSIASFIVIGSIPVLQKITTYTMAWAENKEGLTLPLRYIWGFSPVYMVLLIGLVCTCFLQESYGKTWTPKEKKATPSK